jgi:hypothetical protein
MEKNIFDILNEGYEHISYIKNVEKNKKQVYQPSIGNMETITTFTITTEVSFDDMIITLSCGTYMENCCHINIKNPQIQYTPNIAINKALHNLLLGALDNLYLQFCITKKDKSSVLEDEFDILTDNMIIGILNQLNKTEIAELSKNHYLNERIYEVAPNIKWNWLDISENPNLSVDFIQRNYNKLCLNTLMKHNVQFNNFIRLGKY